MNSAAWHNISQEGYQSSANSKTEMPDRIMVTGHYVAMLNRHWRMELAEIRVLSEEAKMDATLTEDVLPWTHGIYAAGLDDKTGIPVARETPVIAP